MVIAAASCYCCISDPSVTVVYNVKVDMELLKAMKQEGFSFELVLNVVPSFGSEGKREFAMYRAHYGLATALVAEDMVAIKANEEKYDWKKGVKTELTFLETIGVLKEHPDITTIAEVASWESRSGRNLFQIPESVEYLSFGDTKYAVSETVMTDYFYSRNGWVAVPGNATVSVEGNVLTITLLRCGAEISADTSKLSVFAPLREVVLVCNSIDYEMTGKELIDALKKEGFSVRRITPDEFSVYRWFSPRLILLGGHKSPEGMGEVSGSILTETEKKMIEKTGPYLFAYDDVDFRHQSIIILAGKDREDTHVITMDRIVDIVMWLQYVG